MRWCGFANVTTGAYSILAAVGPGTNEVSCSLSCLASSTLSLLFNPCIRQCPPQTITGIGPHGFQPHTAAMLSAGKPQSGTQDGRGTVADKRGNEPVLRPSTSEDLVKDVTS